MSIYRTLNVFILFVLMLFMVACGGTNSSTNLPKKTSKLIDSPVSGVSYSCLEILGVTTNGDFKYNDDCGVINFQVGGVLLSKIESSLLPTDGKLYISELAGQNRSDSTNIIVVNILRFLQSLDEDNNPNNGIFITSVVRNKLKDTSIDLSKRNITELELINIVRKAGKTLISRKSAIEHFENILRTKENLMVDTIAPLMPKLLSTVPFQTKKNIEKIEISGEVESTIYINNKKITAIDSTKKTIISLDTSGHDGKKSFNIILKDAYGNKSNALKVSIIKDTTAPVITLNGSKDITIPLNQVYTELNATANDINNGDLSQRIEIIGTVNTLSVGVNILRYLVQDELGNESNIIRTVTVLPILKKTNQIKSYGIDGSIITDNTQRDDSYYQKGRVINYSRNDNKEIVIDNITGLMWQDNEAASVVQKNWITYSNYESAEYTNRLLAKLRNVIIYDEKNR